MDKVVQMIREYLSSWSKSRTFDYDTFYDVMYHTVAIFQEANGNILEDIIPNACYSTPGLFHYLVEVNEISKALGDKYTMLQDSVSLSSVYSQVLLNFLEGPLKHVLLCILYALKKKSSPNLALRRFYGEYPYLNNVVNGLQHELRGTGHGTMLSSILSEFVDVKLPFIRNKVAHHDYHIVTTKKQNNSLEVKGILFIDNHDITNPNNVYIEISKLGQYIRYVESLIIVLISSIDVFVKTSLEERGIHIENVGKKCESCGAWKLDIPTRFSGECQVCGAVARQQVKKEHRKARFHVTGPGIVRAVQEATDTGKELVTVPKYDTRTDEIIEIGYFLAEKGKPIDPDWQMKMKWLKRSEFSVVYDTSDQESDVEAELEATYSPPDRLKKKGREFLLTLDLPGSKIMRFRNVFKTQQSTVSSFVVQFELCGFKREPEQWKVIARYDCAHGYIHRDLIHADGRKEKKKTRSQDLGEAIKIAANDLKNNFREWISKLGYSEILATLPSQTKIDKEIDEAQIFLLDLLEHPEKIDKVSSTYKHKYYHDIRTSLPEG